MARIFITRQIPQAGIHVLTNAGHEVTISPHDRPLSRAEFLREIGEADAVITLLTDKVDAEALEAAPRAKGFANFAVGYDNMDVAAATERKVPLSNTPGVLTDATAELAWALLFAVSRRVVESDRVMRSGGWSGWGPLQFIGGDVHGKTLGIVGAGRIGTAMALKSRGFDMPVVYTNERPNPILEEKLGARLVDLDTLVSEADFISIHVPLLPTTRHLFDRELLARMKPTAYLINTSRGPVVNEADLVAALRTGEIAGAGLDVFEFEPKMAAGLAERENVVVTPHVASATTESRNGMAELAARNVLAMLAGKRPETCLNPEIFDR
jgi:glyoxylate reductase